MTDLTDFIRLEHEPALRSRDKKIREQAEEIERLWEAVTALADHFNIGPDHNPKDNWHGEPGKRSPYCATCIVYAALTPSPEPAGGEDGETFDYPGELQKALQALQEAEDRETALEAVVEAAREVANSPVGNRYGFLPLQNALDALDGPE